MAYNDQYKISVHAVITNERNEVLLLKATYGSLAWGFPGGAIDPGDFLDNNYSRHRKQKLSVDYAPAVQYGVGYEEELF